MLTRAPCAALRELLPVRSKMGCTSLLPGVRDRPTIWQIAEVEESYEGYYKRQG
jgi:hypothetical protein